MGGTDPQLLFHLQRFVSNLFKEEAPAGAKVNRVFPLKTIEQFLMLFTFKEDRVVGERVAHTCFDLVSSSCGGKKERTGGDRISVLTIDECSIPTNEVMKLHSVIPVGVNSLMP